MASCSDLHSPRWQIGCFALFICFWTVTSVHAQQTSDLGDQFEKLWQTTDNKWVSYGQGDTLAGNRSVNSGGELMTPFWQNQSSLLFGDFRGRTNDHSGIEGNLGIAYRTITSSGWIVGGSAYYDIRRSNFGNTFQQAALGIEAMSLAWDARFNGYIPDGRSYTVANGLGVGPATTVLNGNQLAINYSGSLIERSYYGFDGEVGYLLASNATGNAEIRGFVGGYNFATTDSRFPNITGPRVRLEGRLYDLNWLFGSGSRLVMGFEYQYDQVRDSQYMGLVQVRIPLGRSNRILTRLERRMLDTLVRDVDVVSQADTVQTNHISTESAQIQSPIDGRWEQVGNVAQANSSSNLSQIVNSLGSTSTVFVDGTGGPLTISNPIVMNDTQRVFGGGEVIELRGATSHDQVSYVVPGAQPTLIAANSSTNVFVVGNNDRIGGFTILGGSNAITASSAATPTGYAVVDRLVVQDTTIGAASTGVSFGDLTNSLIQNVTSSGNAGFGFAMNSLTNTVLEHNVAHHNSDGFLINGTVSPDSTFRSNSASGNGVNGFQFDGAFHGQFVNNSASANGNGGMVWASALTGAVANNTSSANGSDGFQFQNGIASSAQFTGNLAVQNSASGVYTTGVDGAFSSNTAAGNRLQGFDLGNISTAGVVNGNLAQNNGHNGFYGTFMNGQFANNVAQSNSHSGVGFINQVGGLVSGNLANDNLGHGFYLNSLASTAVVRDNTAINNTTGFAGVGFYGYTQNAGQMTGNLAKNNTNEGFWFTEQLTGTISGNTASGNGTDGFSLTNGIGSTGQFNGNTSNNNSDKGYLIGPNSGSASANTGSGNTNGQNQYP